MNIVVDTSVIIAILTNEIHKRQLIEITAESDLIAPASLHWEIGNAFSAMFKRNRISLEQAISAIRHYKHIPIQFCDVSLNISMELSEKYKIYAYDAYFLECAMKQKAKLLSLDKQLIEIAKNIGVKVIEVTS